MDRVHDLQQWFLRMRTRNILHHAYLITGPSTSEKHACMAWIMRMLVCENPTEFGACGGCSQCILYEQDTHPDVLMMGRDVSRPHIGIEEARELRAHYGIKAREGGMRLSCMYNAHTMTEEASNSLLKILEEPPLDTLCILSASTHTRIIPTIRSRVVLIPLYVGEYSIKEQRLKELLTCHNKAERVAYVQRIAKKISDEEGGVRAWHDVIDGWMGECTAYLRMPSSESRPLFARIARLLITLKYDVKEYASPKLYAESFALMVV